MKAKLNFKKLTVTFTNIMNESQLEDVTLPADQSGCRYEQLDYSTKVIVTAPSEAHLDKFMRAYSK